MLRDEDPEDAVQLSLEGQDRLHIQALAVPAQPGNVAAVTEPLRYVDLGPLGWHFVGVVR